MVGLGVFSAVFEVGDGLTTKAGHVGQLSYAQAFTLAEYAEVGDAMRVFCGPLLMGMWFHLFLSFEVQFGPPYCLSAIAGNWAECKNC